MRARGWSRRRAGAAAVGLVAALGLAAGGCEGDAGPAPEPDPGLPAGVGPDAPAGDAADPLASDSHAEVEAGPVGAPYPEPDAWTMTGPGLPAVSFPAEALGEHCAYLDGGPKDWTDHHNLVVPYDGFLLMPWAPESGQGGLALFDMSDPCAPVHVGDGFSMLMRESHSIGFSSVGGRWAVVDSVEAVFEGGVLFWDMSDPFAPVEAGHLTLPGFMYPDAYARVTLSVFWQAPFVYAGGADNGVYVIDATDPTTPELVTTYAFDPVLRVGQVVAIGDLLVVTSAEQARVALLDISDPADPQPIPGGDFLVRDGEGEPREYYFANVGGPYALFARKDSGGGVILYDITDPTEPTYVGDHRSDGNGGYVFYKEGLAFTGESSFGAVYDVSDPTAITELGRYLLKGDLDTFTPYGNLGALAVDDKAALDEATALVPITEEPDTMAPTVDWSFPPDGASVTPTSRFGLVMSEMIEPMSGFEGSVRLYRAGEDPALGRVDGYVSVQESIVGFWPVEPLEPGEAYTLEVPAGGLMDVAGNRIEAPWTQTVTVLGGPPRQGAE